MQKAVHFRIDPKLAHVLGESYTSSEKALEELIDNAWDAEATKVHVTVPNILTDSRIVMKNNGSGMKTVKVESEYLNIASPRFSRKGDRTPNFDRTVKAALEEFGLWDLAFMGTQAKHQLAQRLLSRSSHWFNLR